MEGFGSNPLERIAQPVEEQVEVREVTTANLHCTVTEKLIEFEQRRIEIVKCTVTSDVDIEEFTRQVKAEILPILAINGEDTVYLGGGMDQQYMDAFYHVLNACTDYPVIAVFNQEKGGYEVLYDENSDYDEGQILPEKWSDN